MLAYLASYKGIWGPHLIIVPTSCLVNWEVEFKRFCPGLKVLCYYGNAKRRKELRVGWTKVSSSNHQQFLSRFRLPPVLNCTLFNYFLLFFPFSRTGIMSSLHRISWQYRTRLLSSEKNGTLVVFPIPHSSSSISCIVSSSFLFYPLYCQFLIPLLQSRYYLILDEAHNIKNFESQRWQTLINFNTQRRLLLTGTPLQVSLRCSKLYL